MGRKQDPLYYDKKWKIFYARWYENGKRLRYSLGTGDRIEANRRLPIVQSTKMSWAEYEKTIAGMNAIIVNSLDDHKIIPPLTMKTSPENISTMINPAIKSGKAFFDPQRNYWIINSLETPEYQIPTDTTATQLFGDQMLRQSRLMTGIDHFQNALGFRNNSIDINDFYLNAVPKLFVDQTTNKRFSEIWLSFLKEHSVISWSAIDEKLCAKFKDWRQTTAISKNGRPGAPPSKLVVNRHMQFLNRSFDEAVALGYLKNNPIRNWRPDTHVAPQQHALSIDELKDFFRDDRLQRDYLINGKKQEFLGYKLVDVYLLIFTACKRRKEILSLKIEDINFISHWVHYIEYKNSSKGTAYDINKAFWTTSAMERLLKRVIGDRTSGYLFPCPPAMKKNNLDDGMLNPEYVSALFKEIVDKIAPDKNLTLQNFRHTATDIMENAGLSDYEQDCTLGHYNIKNVLRHYQDKSVDAVSRRLSAITKTGIEVLSRTVEEFL